MSAHDLERNHQPGLPVLLSGLLQGLVQHARRYRIIYTALALGIFAVGLWLSFRTMGLDGLKFQLGPLLLNLLVGAPIAIALNAVGFQLAGRMVGTTFGFVDAFRICSIATASNVLPIPAGSIFQSSALAFRGAGIMQSGGIVVLGNLASLAIVVVVVGSILLTRLPLFGSVVLVIGGMVLATAWLVVSRVAGAKMAVGFLFVRLVLTMVMVLRIQLSFLIIGLSVSLLDAAAFTGAVALGTTMAIFPAGLGVSESLAAMTAKLLSVPSAMAFMATALNRVSTIVFAATTGSLLSLTPPKQNYT